MHNHVSSVVRQVQRAASYVSSSNGMLWGTLDPRCVEFESVREQLAGPLGAVGESSCAPNTQPGRIWSLCS